MEQIIPPSTGNDAQNCCQFRLYPNEESDDWEEEYTGPYYADMEDEQASEEDAECSITCQLKNMEPFRAEHLLSNEKPSPPGMLQSGSDGYLLEAKTYDNSKDLYFLKPDRYQPEPYQPEPYQPEPYQPDRYQPEPDEVEPEKGYAFNFEEFQFDPDECLEYLINDAGTDLARNFRYSDGIDELHHRLMCRYGDRNVGEAIGILHSLLEDDDASGLGDDGDCFRCWRHEFKYRGEDLSNPGTPKFPGIILPPIPRKKKANGSSPQQSPGSATIEDGYNTLRPLRFTAMIGSRSPGDVSIKDPPETPWFLRTASASLDPSASVSHEKMSKKAKGVALAREKLRFHREMVQKMVPKRFTNPFKKLKQEIHNTDNTQGIQNNEIKVPFEPHQAVAYPARPPLFHFGFDGATDEQDNNHQSQPSQRVRGDLLSRFSNGRYSIDKPSDESYNGNTSFIDLNRALPPVPANTLQNAEQMNRTSFPDNFSSSSTAVPSGHHSHSSSKHHFQHITRELLTPAYLEPSVAPQHSLDALDPNKFSPPPSRETQNIMNDAYAQYRLTIGNPFAEERQTQWPSVNGEQTKWQPSEFLTAFEAHQPSKPKGMSHSRSEGSIALVAGPTPIDTSRANKQYVQPAAFRTTQSGNLSPIRGRSNSPVKFMDEIKEQVTPEAPHNNRKRSRSPVKKMFGENGWLGRSISLKDMSNESPKKTGLKHWGGKLIQRVEGITEDVSKKLPHPFHPDSSSKQSVQSKFPVSLNPLAQAKLSSEVELMICATANSFLMSQKRHGLMSLESITKIVDVWKNKGRPQVIQFQFDQATQRDLILYNIKTFRFCGPQADDAFAINSMMYNWKSVAKEMSVRTFCTPDSVIRKHMHDIYKILEMLGAPEVTFLAFQNISVNAAKTMRDAQRKRDEQQFIQYGVERPWYPPIKEAPEANGGLDDFFEG